MQFVLAVNRCRIGKESLGPRIHGVDTLIGTLTPDNRVKAIRR